MQTFLEFEKPIQNIIEQIVASGLIYLNSHADDFKVPELRALAVARITRPERYFLLVETDAPSGRFEGGPERNEPAALVRVVQTLAQLRGQSVEHVAAVTRANAHRLFQLTD